VQAMKYLREWKNAGQKPNLWLSNYYYREHTWISHSNTCDWLLW
jgi:hypothetical protein